MDQPDDRQIYDELLKPMTELATQANAFKLTGAEVDIFVGSLKGLSTTNLFPNGEITDESLIQCIQATLAYVSTLLYINPDASDISDRVEEKLYELTQQSTNIANKIVLENIGFYRYNGQDPYSYADNAFNTMFQSKSKGSDGKIAQVAGLLGQQDLEGKRQGDFYYQRSLPHFTKKNIEPRARGYVQNSYLKGLTMLEYFSHGQADRKSVV